MCIIVDICHCQCDVPVLGHCLGILVLQRDFVHHDKRADGGYGSAQRHILENTAAVRKRTVYNIKHIYIEV